MAGAEKKRRWLNSCKRVVLDGAEAINYQSSNLINLKNLKFNGELKKEDLLLILTAIEDVLLHLAYAYQLSLDVVPPYVTNKTEGVQKHIVAIERQLELFRTQLPSAGQGYYK